MHLLLTFFHSCNVSPYALQLYRMSIMVSHITGNAQSITKTKMSFWRNFTHWLHWKLSFWQFPVQPMIKFSSNWSCVVADRIIFSKYMPPMSLVVVSFIEEQVVGKHSSCSSNTVCQCHSKGEGKGPYCPACRTTLIATRFWVVMICPIIKCLTVLRVFFYFVWFVFIHHNFQFYFELCTYCNILDIYLS